MSNRFKAGRPYVAGRKPIVNKEITDSALVPMRWRCFCSTNIFKSKCCRCPRCGELAMLADDYIDQERELYSPKVMKPTVEFDSRGNPIDKYGFPTKMPKSANKPVKIECDFTNEKNYKNKKK